MGCRELQWELLVGGRGRGPATMMDLFLLSLWGPKKGTGQKSCVEGTGEESLVFPVCVIQQLPLNWLLEWLQRAGQEC